MRKKRKGQASEWQKWSEAIAARKKRKETARMREHESKLVRTQGEGAESADVSEDVANVADVREDAADAVGVWEDVAEPAVVAEPSGSGALATELSRAREMKHPLALNVKRKNRRKKTAVVVQTLILLGVVAMLIDVFFIIEKYEEPDRSQWTQRDGFIALSYFGVNRTGTPKLMERGQLAEQLRALYDRGYETISQQDVLDFYYKGSPLPDKALFLSFEDGRNDSSLYAQPILERLNYKATFLTYANKMGNSEGKFVQPKDLLDMMKSGYWEMGSNGYRLTYINTFDKDGKYLGIIDESEISEKTFMEHYNHYLMDFIRDEYMIPVENRDEMVERITEDYRLMDEIYSKSLGFVPPVYMIMHANAMYGGMNPLVSSANDAQIRSIFKLHFNREGVVYNDKDSDVYNLTRVQPAPYWPTNHLLMKIRKDTQQDVSFVIGNERKAEQWSLANGAAEFQEDEVILTSAPGKEAMLTLREGDKLQNFRLEVSLSGNVVGKQSIYLRYNPEQRSYIRMTLDNNRIDVDVKKPGELEERVLAQELNDIRWAPEDVAYEKATVYSLEQSITGREDEEEFPINIANTRKVKLEVLGGTLRLTVDKEELLQGWKIDSSLSGGSIALSAEYSEKNRKEDIYDGRFVNLEIHTLSQDGKTAEMVFRNQKPGYQTIMYKIRSFVNGVINWAIEAF